jgi:hypothetical protein
MGSGTSIVDLQSVVKTGATSIDTGAGGDIVLIDNAPSEAGFSTFGATLTINLGAGDDSLFAGSYPNDVNAGNTFNGNVTIDGGAGSDSALIKNPAAPSGATRNNTSMAPSPCLMWKFWASILV